MTPADKHEAQPLGLRLLVVEDEAMVAMLLETLLEELGCTVTRWAATVPAALKAIEHVTIDGALLDVNLAGTKVYAVAEALAARNIPFVFVTGYGRIDASETRFSQAAVLKKPFETVQLQRVLEDNIRRRSV